MTDIRNITANPFVEQWVDEYFVGRESELKVFIQNLKGLSQGRPNNILVSGLHGTGKSYFLNKIIGISKTRNLASVFLELDEGVSAMEQARTIVRETISQIADSSTRERPGSEPLLHDWDRSLSSSQFSLPKKNELTTPDFRHDVKLIADYVNSQGVGGIVICIDEGQRINQTVLSCMKNALNRVGSVLVVLSWRLTSLQGGAQWQGKDELEKKAGAGEGDIGAAAFFSNSIGMGPFKDSDEVLSYFETRLSGNEISFRPEVAVKIGEICSRVPRLMTSFASLLYSRAIELGVDVVNVEILNHCFRDRFFDELKESTDLCGEMSEHFREILRALCQFRQPVTSTALINHAFPGCSSKQMVLAEAVSSQLDGVVGQVGFVLREEDKYCVADDIYRYAMMLALGCT